MKKEINELFTDYKATSLAADLVDRDYIDIDKLELLPIGGAKRAYSKDINKVTPYFSDHRNQNRLRIEINRESLYDMLPEGIFHEAPKGGSQLDDVGMIDDVRNRREEERNARLFFSPFDAELYHTRLLIEQYENRLDKKTHHPDFNRLFELGWREFKLLNKFQSIIWMHLIPEIKQKRNDLNFLATIAYTLFNLKFSIHSFKAPVETEVQSRWQCSLGNNYLGLNTVVGHAIAEEQQQISIQIGPAPSKKLQEFLPGKKNRLILNMLLDHLIPIETQVNIELVKEEVEVACTLNNEYSNNYLGYTSYI